MLNMLNRYNFVPNKGSLGESLKAEGLLHPPILTADSNHQVILGMCWESLGVMTLGTVFSSGFSWRLFRATEIK